MTYSETAKVRERALGSSTDTSQDTILTNFMTEADDQIDNELYRTAAKNSRLTALPVLPLSSPSQTVKDASSDRAASLWFLSIHELDIADRYMQLSKSAIESYVSRLQSDERVYGVIIT